MASTTRIPDELRLSYTDLVGLFDDPDDRRRYELYDGVLAVTPSPTRSHQRVLIRLAGELEQFTRANQLGEIYTAPFDVLLASNTVLQPDILFVCRANLSSITEAYVGASPDLVIEILSPSTSRRDRGAKRELYARFGAGEYWIIDPVGRLLERYVAREHQLRLERTLGPDDTITTGLMPGLAIPMATLFE